MTNNFNKNSLADKAFAEYNFGDGITVTGTSGWEQISPGKELTRKVYVETERKDDGPASSWVLSFVVRFHSELGDVAEVYAFDKNGQIWGDLSKITQLKSNLVLEAEDGCNKKPVILPAPLSWCTVAEHPEIGICVQEYFVTDPFCDVGLIEKVDPLEYWGLNEEQAKFIVGINEQLNEAVNDAINAACLRLQNFVGINEGDFAGVHFSDPVQRNKLMEVFAAYIVADVNFNKRYSQPSPALCQTAYEATVEDVENVLRSNSLAVANTSGKPFEAMAKELHSSLDFDLIEQAALIGDDLDEQTDYAIDEITRQLREMGVLEPLKQAYELPVPGM